MCVNNILTTPATFPFLTASSLVFGAMDGIHADLHYNKFISEYNCRRALHSDMV
jgi:hypothetical protein